MPGTIAVRGLVLGLLFGVCGICLADDGVDKAWLDALRANNIESAAGLVDRVTSVDLAPSDGRTALMLSAKRGMSALVERLVSDGANVNASNHNGGTPLMYAAISGVESIGQLLIDKRANVNARGSNGWSPIMVAAAKGHQGFVQLLIQAGADVNARDVYLWTPLGRASFENRLAVVETLIKTAEIDLDLRDDQGATALHHAAAGGFANIVELLIEAGADASIRDHKSLTARDRAAQLQHDAVLNILSNERL